MIKLPQKIKPKIIADVRIRSPTRERTVNKKPKQDQPTSQRDEATSTRTDEEEVPLGKRIKQKDEQQQKLVNKRKRSSGSSNTNHHSGKEPRRFLQSRLGPLAGAMEPEAQPLTRDAYSPVNKNEGERELRRPVTASNAVKLPAVSIGEPDREETVPAVLTEKSEVQVRTHETPDSPVASTSGK